MIVLLCAIRSWGDGRRRRNKHITTSRERLLIIISPFSTDSTLQDTRKSFPFRWTEERRENFSASLLTFPSLVAEWRVRETIVLSSFRNTTCVEDNLSYRQEDPEVERSLCVSLRQEFFSFTIFLLIFTFFFRLSILAGDASVVVQHPLHSHVHTLKEPEKISFMHHRKAEGMFFRGGEGKTKNSIPNDEWRFRSINENAPTVVD